ncbi:conserved Plasmodium protein, unknown function [Plasmodium berghei]|uniref:Uncharacterized protein n=2 Tax=Plasmodium berghei TaxID=5821 RepID=A0A509ALY7_PLABA|nr:conserved protein, unknown function [Plasmodium berghei ANKA]CXI77483.1 conserved Plasmodium protein, unknown function [Plasmodium berghei]SCM25051.1 conserved Plasmodium protein, unknown function [Plasmodium berghei]SCN27247.1 conserved Plasmodium protein, unknown function [Plasmodium berghei]SCO61837.1 conserved Plasmodium protein, unknown function [Plasmodium berghei]VUC57104.1 conserved protein, unknown function [Plasmodium berghei ANKA]|eukprot:XP_034422883.1 conserved protein, unknown function [Plasmodium berghei ANKA]
MNIRKDFVCSNKSEKENYKKKYIYNILLKDGINYIENEHNEIIKNDNYVRTLFFEYDKNKNEYTNPKKKLEKTSSFKNNYSENVYNIVSKFDNGNLINYSNFPQKDKPFFFRTKQMKKNISFLNKNKNYLIFFMGHKKKRKKIKWKKTKMKENEKFIKCKILNKSIEKNKNFKKEKQGKDTTIYRYFCKNIINYSFSPNLYYNFKNKQVDTLFSEKPSKKFVFENNISRPYVNINLSNEVKSEFEQISKKDKNNLKNKNPTKSQNNEYFTFQNINNFLWGQNTGTNNIYEHNYVTNLKNNKNDCSKDKKKIIKNTSNTHIEENDKIQFSSNLKEECVSFPKNKQNYFPFTKEDVNSLKQLGKKDSKNKILFNYEGNTFKKRDNKNLETQLNLSSAQNISHFCCDKVGKKRKKNEILRKIKKDVENNILDNDITSAHEKDNIKLDKKNGNNNKKCYFKTQNEMNKMESHKSYGIHKDVRGFEETLKFMKYRELLRKYMGTFYNYSSLKCASYIILYAVITKIIIQISKNLTTGYMFNEPGIDAFDDNYNNGSNVLGNNNIFFLLNIYDLNSVIQSICYGILLISIILLIKLGIPSNYLLAGRLTILFMFLYLIQIPIVIYSNFLFLKKIENNLLDSSSKLYDKKNYFNLQLQKVYNIFYIDTINLLIYTILISGVSLYATYNKLIYPHLLKFYLDTFFLNSYSIIKKEIIHFRVPNNIDAYYLNKMNSYLFNTLYKKQDTIKNEDIESNTRSAIGYNVVIKKEKYSFFFTKFFRNKKQTHKKSTKRPNIKGIEMDFYIIFYIGELDRKGRPHGFGYWRGIHSEGEVLIGYWYHGIPVGPFKCRDLKTGSGFMCIKIGYGHTSCEPNDLKIGLADTECCVSGAFYRTFPRVVFYNLNLTLQDSKKKTRKKKSDKKHNYYNHGVAEKRECCEYLVVEKASNDILRINYSKIANNIYSDENPECSDVDLANDFNSKYYKNSNKKATDTEMHTSSVIDSELYLKGKCIDYDDLYNLSYDINELALDEPTLNESENSLHNNIESMKSNSNNNMENLFNEQLDATRKLESTRVLNTNEKHYPYSRNEYELDNICIVQNNSESHKTEDLGCNDFDGLRSCKYNDNNLRNSKSDVLQYTEENKITFESNRIKNMDAIKIGNTLNEKDNINLKKKKKKVIMDNIKHGTIHISVEKTMSVEIKKKKRNTRNKSNLENNKNNLYNGSENQTDKTTMKKNKKIKSEVDKNKTKSNDLILSNVSNGKIGVKEKEKKKGGNVIIKFENNKINENKDTNGLSEKKINFKTPNEFVKKTSSKQIKRKVKKRIGYSMKRTIFRLKNFKFIKNYNNSNLSDNNKIKNEIKKNKKTWIMGNKKLFIPKTFSGTLPKLRIKKKKYKSLLFSEYITNVYKTKCMNIILQNLCPHMPNFGITYNTDLHISIDAERGLYITGYINKKNSTYPILRDKNRKTDDLEDNEVKIKIIKKTKNENILNNNKNFNKKLYSWIDNIKELSLEGWVRCELAGSLEAVIFIHGYNTSHLEALQILGQMASFGNFPNYIKLFLFNWPSGKNILEFFIARENSKNKEIHHAFKSFLNTLRNNGIKQIHIITHSMGTRMFLLSFHDIVKGELFSNIDEEDNVENNKNKMKLITLTMMNPEYSLNDFVNKEYIFLRSYCTVISIYCDSNDKALKWAEIFSGTKSLGKNIFDLNVSKNNFSKYSNSSSENNVFDSNKLDCYSIQIDNNKKHTKNIKNFNTNYKHSSSYFDWEKCEVINEKQKKTITTCFNSSMNKFLSLIRFCFLKQKKVEIKKDGYSSNISADNEYVDQTVKYNTDYISSFEGKQNKQNNLSLKTNLHHQPPMFRNTLLVFTGIEPNYCYRDNRDWLDVDVIDTTWLGSNVHTLRHSYWSLNREIIEDIRELIVTRKRARQRTSRLDRREGNVWVYRVAPSHLKSIFDSDI